MRPRYTQALAASAAGMVLAVACLARLAHQPGVLLDDVHADFNSEIPMATPGWQYDNYANLNPEVDAEPELTKAGKLNDAVGRQKRMEQELEIAREFQEMLLPRKLPQPSGYTLDAVNRAAKIEKQTKAETVRALCDAATFDIARQQGYVGPAEPKRLAARRVEGIDEPVDLAVRQIRVRADEVVEVLESLGHGGASRLRCQTQA